MIDFRYHVVSLISIFLALAAGVVLGAGPLSSAVDNRLKASASTSQPDLRDPVQDFEQLQSFQSDFADTVGPSLLDGVLDGRTVAVFTLPGADPDTVDALSTEVKTAGGSVASEIALKDKLVDPSGRQFVEGVATQALDGAKRVDTSTDQSSYELVGTALARAFLTADSASSGVDASAGTIASAFADAKLVKYADDPAERADLALVVAGDPATNAVAGQDELVSTLVQSMDAASAGAVVAGPPSSAAGNGYVKALRDRSAADTVSTVDVASAPDGQVVTMLVLAAEADGSTGQYGAVDAADGAMPETQG